MKVYERTEYLAHMRETRRTYRILVVKPLGERSVRTPKEDNTELNVSKTECKVVECIKVAQNWIYWRDFVS
jgi:hypothetical protein